MNEPQVQPVVNQPTATMPSVPKKGPSVVLVILITILLTALVAGGGVFLVLSSMIPVTSVRTVDTATDDTNTPTETTDDADTTTPATDETANWKTYSNQTYSLKYPSDWEMTIPTTSQEYIRQGGYKEVYAEFTSPSGENTFTVIPYGYLPYGFGGGAELKSDKSTVQIKGKDMDYTETYTLDANGNPQNNEKFTFMRLNNSYTFDSTYDGCTGANCGTSTYFSALFGNTYPVAATERNVSLDTYKADQAIFFKVLGTVNFKQAL